jgi:hypothetical protein
MVMDSFFFTVVFLILVGGVLIAPMFTSSRRASAELKLKPTWQARCSGKLGVLSISIPVIRVALYQDFMVIAFLGQTVIPYREIAEVSVKQGFSFLGSSGVHLRLKGMRSGYHFNLSDPKAFAKLVEPHLTTPTESIR